MARPMPRRAPVTSASRRAVSRLVIYGLLGALYLELGDGVGRSGNDTAFGKVVDLGRAEAQLGQNVAGVCSGGQCDAACWQYLSVIAHGRVYQSDIVAGNGEIFENAIVPDLWI